MILLRASDLFRETLVNHRLRDGINPVAFCGGVTLGIDINHILQPAFVRSECQSVNRVDNHRHSCHASGDAPDDPRFGTVRVKNVELTFLKEFFQVENRPEIGKRRNFTHKQRAFDYFKPRIFHFLEQLPFAPLGGACQHNALVSGLHKPAGGKKCILLGAADNQPCDKMAYLHSRFQLAF